MLLVKKKLHFAWMFFALLLISCAGFYLHPDSKSIPPVYVVGMPPVEKDISLPSYQGLHPSVISRPEETFTFPIHIGEVGPVEPLFAGEPQYPFLCGIRRSGLGQPLIDNYQGWGVPVYKLNKQGTVTDQVMGYSKDCLLPTQANYYYKRVDTEDSFYPLSQANDDIEKIVVNGKEIDFVVRVEIGTINRFLYMIVALRGDNETLDNPNGSNWNQKLIYQFRGGVGIGYRQGRLSPRIIFKRRYEQLVQGYAVIYSTGTQTSNHYNLWTSEDVALRVKKQFTALYGEPLYTVGIGGSGGAVQQYILAQNNPDILDAAIAEYAYPDMVTQKAYAMDCELLEYFFDVTDRNNPRWQDWENRRDIEGLNASAEITSRFRWFQRLSQIRSGVFPSMENGETECANGWRGLTALVNNPTFTHKAKYYHPDVVESVNWTHWNDLKLIYGTDEQGYGRTTWDNVGVQYGLKTLLDNKITIDEFLKLNASIGGWKAQKDLRKEHFWFLNGDVFPIRISIWSHKNMRHGTLEKPAVRSEGHIKAMHAVYRSGHVFLGHLPIPLIDLRHYLEDELDMHHLSASFSARKRLLREQGHSENHLIWVTRKPHTGEPEAFAVLDQWLTKKAKPKQAVDTCFDNEGKIIAAGSDVWNGAWNDLKKGACMDVYPSYSVSRQLAGADVAGDIFKCHLQPVKTALDKGVYGSIDMSSYQQILEKIFPQGVCDYSKGDMGKPTDLLLGSRLLQDIEQSPQQVISEATDRNNMINDVELEELPVELSLDDEQKERIGKSVKESL